MIIAIFSLNANDKSPVYGITKNGKLEFARVKAFFGNPSPSQKVTRADLADFMLKQLI